MADDMDLTLPRYQLPEFELPDIAPIIAGAQGPIGWVRDRIGDVLGLGLDLVSFIAESLSRLGEWIWEWIGGAIRFVYGWLVSAITDVLNWIWTNANTIVNFVISQADRLWNWILARVGDVIGAVTSAANWIARVVADAVSGLYNWLVASISSLFNVVWDAANWVQDRLWEAADWVKDRVWDAADWVQDRLWEAADWLKDRVWEAADWVKDRIWDAAGWLKDNVLDPVMAGFQDIGDAFREGFEFLGGKLEDFATLLGDNIRDGVSFFGELLGVPIDAFAGGLADKLLIVPRAFMGTYDSWGDLWDAVTDPWPIALIPLAIVAMLLISSVGQVSGQALAVGMERATQEQRALIGARLLTVQELLDVDLRDIPVTDGPAGQLARWGYDQTNIEALRRLRQLIPGPSDLVRMGVREVFTPEIAERFGQFQDFPPAFADWMQRQGFTPEWARNFWAAHWDLPSAGQGFEMLHRGVITQEELGLLLRALDVMPYWRDRLTQISYNPLTRVDIRRVFKAGVVQRDKVLQVYRALGYSPEDAEILTTWVVKEYAPGKDVLGSSLANLTVATLKSAYARRLIIRDQVVESLIEQDYSAEEADLIVSTWEYDWTIDPSSRGDVNLKAVSRSVIEDAYEAGLVDFNAAVAELQEQGFTPEDASLVLQLVDLKQARQLAELEADVAVQEYRKALITDAELASRLRDLNIPQARVDLLVRLEIARRRTRAVDLTVAQLIRAFRADALPEAALRTRLAAKGYDDSDIDLLLVDEPVQVGVGALQRALRDGVITLATFQSELQARGFSALDAEILTPEERRELTTGQLLDAMVKEVLPEAEVRDRLAARGYSVADVAVLVALAAPS